MRTVLPRPPLASVATRPMYFMPMPARPIVQLHTSTLQGSVISVCPPVPPAPQQSIAIAVRLTTSSLLGNAKPDVQLGPTRTALQATALPVVDPVLPAQGHLHPTVLPVPLEKCSTLVLAWVHVRQTTSISVEYARPAPSAPPAPHQQSAQHVKQVTISSEGSVT